MRDAESLLDRLLVTGTKITASAAEDALGLPPQDRLFAMSDAVLGADLAGLLDQAAEFYRAGYAPRTIAEQLTRVLRDRLQELLHDGKAAKKQASRRDDLLKLIQALDDEHDRFARRNDLYSLEVALIKAGNAVRFAATPGAQPLSGPASAAQHAARPPVAAPPPTAAAQQQQAAEQGAAAPVAQHVTAAPAAPAVTPA